MTALIRVYLSHFREEGRFILHFVDFIAQIMMHRHGFLISVLFTKTLLTKMDIDKPLNCF